MNHLKIFMVIAILFILFIGCDDEKEKPVDILSLLITETKAKDYFSITDEHVSTYAGRWRKKLNIAECRIYKDEFKAFNQILRYFDRDRALDIYRNKGRSRFPESLLKELKTLEDDFPYSSSGRALKGLRVALDPGHTASSFKNAIDEKKYVWVRGPGGDIKFYEATLNLGTALMLKKMLEKDGARVMLTRSRPGVSSFGKTFDEWLMNDYESSIKSQLKAGSISKKDAARLRKTRDRDEKLKYFLKTADLRNRAHIINQFRPHCSLSIHYNTSGYPRGFFEKRIEAIRKLLKNEKLNRDSKLDKIYKEAHILPLTWNNFFVVYAPGGFAPGELQTPQSRMEFLRLITSNDLKDSVSLSRHIARYFKKDLGVKPMPASMVNAFHRATGFPGVYSRNLKMTRLVHGAATIGEPFIQNSRAEASNLIKKSITIQGLELPKRTRETAAAYYKAIHAWVKEKRYIRKKKGRR